MPNRLPDLQRNDGTVAVQLLRKVITACTVVQCSVMDDFAFLWEHAIFGPPAHHNPLTDRYEILLN
jgi:hypothetical protein